MAFIYQVGIIIYGILIRFASVFNNKARLFVKGRQNWESKLKNQILIGHNYLWFHCASLGEFEQGRPLIEEIKSMHPDYKIILTFFSPSGYEIRKNYSGADIICYLPLDTKKNARLFLEIVQPTKAFFVKYEFWYNFLTETNRKNIPIFIISGIFRKSQLFFKTNFIGRWYKKVLSKPTHFFIQDDESGQLLTQNNITNFTKTGDTRFDRVLQITESVKKIPIVEKFKGYLPLIIIGSSWKPDEEIVTNFINQSKSTKFIIAPHEVNEGNINRILKLLKVPTAKFSQVNEQEIDNISVLIIDSIGLLSSLYQYGDIAYIGGGFGVGIHNILEAATFGQPVIFGPNYKRFKEANDLIFLKGAFSIDNYSALKKVFDLLLNDAKKLKNTSQICTDFIKHNVGATGLIIKKVFNI